MAEIQEMGIVDEARDLRVNEPDLLKLDDYAKALATFIRTTNTPMTVGIQGEWGSGKTSLLYSIWSDLESPDGVSRDDKNLIIWVNSWEHSLLVTPEESLLSIVRQITEEITRKDAKKDSHEKIKNATKLLGTSALRIAAAAALGSKGGHVADELVGAKGSSTVRQLRDALKEVIDDIRTRETNPYKRVIVFVDDLDRIEPANAVRVLELMKNIFSMQHCVFVLAIDYNVVVKGLKEKFGEKTEENEWEFRAFFDKIIQLPFMMPIGIYPSGHYFESLLRKVGFLKQGEMAEALGEILANSIGNNPRAIKRLVNSVVLIRLLNETNAGGDEGGGEASDEESTVRKQVLIALLALQISAPKIYEMLADESDFTDWTQGDTAFGITHKKEEKIEGFQEQFDLMTAPEAGEDFDEEWERALYRVCYNNPSLRKQVSKLSRLLSLVQKLCIDNEEELGDTITWAREQTAVTSISTEAAPAVPSGPRLSGKGLAQEWGIHEEMGGKKHMKTYSCKTGLSYTTLKKFPGAYCDENGYIIFKTKEEYKNGEQVQVRRGKGTVYIKGGISQLSGYVRKIKQVD